MNVNRRIPVLSEDEKVLAVHTKELGLLKGMSFLCGITFLCIILEICSVAYHDYNIRVLLFTVLTGTMVVALVVICIVFASTEDDKLEYPVVRLYHGLLLENNNRPEEEQEEQDRVLNLV